MANASADQHGVGSAEGTSAPVYCAEIVPRPGFNISRQPQTTTSNRKAVICCRIGTFGLDLGHGESGGNRLGRLPGPPLSREDAIGTDRWLLFCAATHAVARLVAGDVPPVTWPAFAGLIHHVAGRGDAGCRRKLDMWLQTACSLEFDAAVETPFIFMLRPRSGAQQWVAREQYVLCPSVQAVEFTDQFGNLCQRLVSPAGPFSIRTSADVQAADSADIAPGAPFVEVNQLPAETLPFLLPSRYCESDRFTQMAPAITAHAAPGYDQCAAIVRYVRETIQYVPGSGQQIISAAEVNERSQAVCRDMSHLGMALCRALSIPSRMVVGYLETLQPMDLHAWFEAYVGGRWYTFDPTQGELNGGRVAIGYGRDATDVAVYTQFGDPVEIQRMSVQVNRIAAPPY